MNKQYCPQFPIYIISKGRWKSRLTVKALEKMQQSFFIVVEEQEFSEYAKVIDKKKILVLDTKYQDVYDTCEIGIPSVVKGSGPARNFCWDHAVKNGYTHHWLMDDNIRDFYRYNDGMKIRMYTPAGFRAMEDFVLRYTNIGLAGPAYELFTPRKQFHPPFTVNTRLFSCILLRNDLPLRWRARYNEDVDLSLRVLKLNYCTVQFNVFLQDKMATQSMRGGNTDILYREGTLEKSQMICRLHPELARMAFRFNRVHHYVDFSNFRQILLHNENIAVAQGTNEYGMVLKQIAPIRSPELQRWYEKHKKK